MPIIGIDPETNEVLYRCSSIAEAHAMGFSNISMIISENYGRTQSKGIRWFKAEDFDPNNIPPIEIPNAKAVYCVERNQHFRSTVDAEEKMRPPTKMVCNAFPFVSAYRQKSVVKYPYEGCFSGTDP